MTTSYLLWLQIVKPSSLCSSMNIIIFLLFETLAVEMSSMIISLLVMVAIGIMFVEGSHEQAFKQEIVSEVA